MAPPRLLAIDVDGTLLRRDGTLAPEDRAAIATARRRGLVVTLATGRLSAGALPLARELDLDAPLVCADGAVLFCPTARAPLSIVAVRPEASRALLDSLRRLLLAPFLFTHEAVIGAASDSALFPHLTGWTPKMQACDDLDAACHADGMAAPVMAIGVGSAGAAEFAETTLRAHPDLGDDVDRFPIGATGHWIVRLAPSGCSKATGLAALARRLGFEPGEVATMGDWHNDLEMLGWSGWSFAMGHAPDEVKRAAKQILTATSASGGAVAEVVGRLEAARRRPRR
jgi:hypothetical protein